MKFFKPYKYQAPQIYFIRKDALSPQSPPLSVIEQR